MDKKVAENSKELIDFAFLIGVWDCDVKIKDGESKYKNHKATWTGRYILNGYAIQDEYREINELGELIRLGVNIRSFDKTNGWTMKWFDALNSTWISLGPSELGGVDVEKSSIGFKHFAPNNIIVRITFFNISEFNFSWKADVSNDKGENWDENVFTIHATRIK